MEAFLSLTSYNKLMGGQGYVPTALGHFSIASQKELITSIATPRQGHQEQMAGAET